MPGDVDRAELIEIMRRDKKALDGLTFVLDGPDGVELVSGISEPDVRAGLEAFT
jgi:5-deoxy-5-amino-3-dehydroquinate synthase